MQLLGPDMREIVQHPVQQVGEEGTRPEGESPGTVFQVCKARCRARREASPDVLWRPVVGPFRRQSCRRRNDPPGKTRPRAGRSKVFNVASCHFLDLSVLLNVPIHVRLLNPVEGLVRAQTARQVLRIDFAIDGVEKVKRRARSVRLDFNDIRVRVLGRLFAKTCARFLDRRFAEQHRQRQAFADGFLDLVNQTGEQAGSVRRYRSSHQ